MENNKKDNNKKDNKNIIHDIENQNLELLEDNIKNNLQNNLQYNLQYNNWTDKNTQTVRSWKSSVSKASFIYESVLEKYKKKLDNTLLLALLFNTIATILSAISVSLLTIDDYRWVAFGFNVVLFILNGCVTLLNGKIKIYKWDELVTTVSIFIEKLDQFYAVIANELVLPDHLRGDAIKFIKDESSNYLTIMQQSPQVYPSDYKIANDDYKKFIEDNSVNFKISQKYNNDDSVIDIV